MYTLIIFAIGFLILGLMCINGGIYIIRKKELHRLESGKYRWSPRRPIHIKGKDAISQGVGYIIVGFIFISASAFFIYWFVGKVW